DAGGPRSERWCPMFSPLARLHQLANLAFDEIALQRADVADVEFAVQVIGLVEEGAGEQLFPSLLEPFSMQILGENRNFAGSRHRLTNLRNAEAAFVLPQPTFGVNNLWIGQNHAGRGVFF